MIEVAPGATEDVASGPRKWGDVVGTGRKPLLRAEQRGKLADGKSHPAQMPVAGLPNLLLAVEVRTQTDKWRVESFVGATAGPEPDRTSAPEMWWVQLDALNVLFRCVAD